MPVVLRWCVGAAIAALLSLTGAGAAVAVEPAPASQAPVVTASAADGPVEGESWSAPTVAANCSRTGNTVTCTPADSASTVVMSCYLGVPLGTERVTVCASSKEAQTALERKGVPKLDYQWGCAQTWDLCGSLESAAEAMSVQAIDAAGRATAAVSFTTKSALWTAALGQWSFWVWAVWIILLIAGIIGITQAAFSGSPADVLAAIVRLAVTIPLTQATLWLMGELSDIVNSLTMDLFASADPFGTIVALLFSGGQVNPFFGSTAALVVLVVCGLMLLVFMVRNVALAALVMVGPVAWMLFPLRTIGKQWVVGYVSAFAATLITGPLMMSLLAFTTSGLRSVNSLWDPAIWPFMIAMIVICFAPLAVFGLFSFAGGSVIDGAAAGAGRAAHSASSRVFRQIPSPRVGGAGGGSRPRPPGGRAGGGGKPGGRTPQPRSASSHPGAGGPAGGPSASPRVGSPVGSPQSAPAPRGGAGRAPGGAPPPSYRSPGRNQQS
ncbi:MULTISPECIES: hypothetical protein [unclassified Microbacterium]|uniref:hypothetical protein n=1 Tax=unclassified Microbacterium TaxID=2609290 RepID=UPI0030194694